jgi:pSer/pThr/pTyr-binding forkhead associated (FHA) protein
LQIIQGEPLYATFSVTTDRFTIGRHSENQLHLPDTSVSRRHAVLRYAEGAWFIQDQESAAGIYVNGRLVPAARLNPGDKIALGDTVLVFYS